MSDVIANDAPEDQELLSVKVVFALPEKQHVKSLTLRFGATVQDAIDKSAITDEIEGLTIDPKMVGIFGTKVPLTQVLQQGDRVEIYRPLIADPKEVRRERAIRQAQSDQ
jgi:putative ubiquitin-RnfH superfamily antitoxin RatB of RatAB toxin-antitoxin module